MTSGWFLLAAVLLAQYAVLLPALAVAALSPALFVVIPPLATGASFAALALVAVALVRRSTPRIV